MKELIAFDTNVLIYSIDKSDPIKHDKAVELFKRVFNAEIMVLFSLQNITEFYQWAAKRKRITTKEATNIINDLINNTNIRITAHDMNSVLFAIQLQQENNSPFYDTLLFTNARLHGATTFITENTKDFKSSMIKVVNPFDA
jgi:predicted nucleic acid-binding protein